MDISLYEYGAWILSQIQSLPSDVTVNEFINEAVREKKYTANYMKKCGCYISDYLFSDSQKSDLIQFKTHVRNHIEKSGVTEPDYYAYMIAEKLDILDQFKTTEEISLYDYGAWIFHFYVDPDSNSMVEIDRAIDAATDSESIVKYMKEAGVWDPASHIYTPLYAKKRAEFIDAVINNDKYACYIAAQLNIKNDILKSNNINNGFKQVSTPSINDSGARISYGDGKAVREPADGKGRFDLVSPFALTRLAKWYELGAKKYSDRNWEKGGIPFSRYLDSAMRHLSKFQMGMTDEDHLAAAAWNIFSILHFQELGVKELDDMPHYILSRDEIESQD